MTWWFTYNIFVRSFHYFANRSLKKKVVFISQLSYRSKLFHDQLNIQFDFLQNPKIFSVNFCMMQTEVLIESKIQQSKYEILHQWSYDTGSVKSGRFFFVSKSKSKNPDRLKRRWRYRDVVRSVGLTGINKQIVISNGSLLMLSSSLLSRQNFKMRNDRPATTRALSPPLRPDSKKIKIDFEVIPITDSNLRHTKCGNHARPPARYTRAHTYSFISHMLARSKIIRAFQPLLHILSQL